MTDIRRAITASQGGAVSSRSKKASANSAIPALRPEPLSCSAAFPKCQASRFPRHSRLTFVAILQAARSSNIVRLKNRAFSANRMAKLVGGTSRSLCYRIKDELINTLVKHGAASLHSLEASSHGPTIGVAFLGGGRLHMKASRLDPQACRELQEQFAATLRSGGNFSGEDHDGSL